MPDIRSLSDSELLDLGKKPTGADILSQMSDEEFNRIAGIEAPAPQGERTLLGKGISAIGGGILGGGEIVSRALRGADQPGGIDVVRGIGEIGLKGVKAVEEKFPILKPAPDEGAISQGIRSAVQSLSTSVPLAVAGGIAGNVPGAVTALGAGSAALYGLAEKDRFIEEAKAAMDAGITPRISDDQLYAQANKAALIEGGLEGLSNVLGFVFTGAGKLFKQPLRGVLAPTIKEAFLKTTPKTVLATTGKVLAEEIPTEVAQEEFGAKLRRDIGVPAPEFGEGLAVIPATTVSSVILAAFGMGAGGIRRRSVLNALDNPELDEKKRIAAVNSVAAEIEKSDPATAKVWKEKAYGLVANKQAIPDDIASLTKPVPPPPTGPLSKSLDLLQPPTTEAGAAGIDVMPFGYGEVTPEPKAAAVPPIKTKLAGIEDIGGEIYTGPEAEAIKRPVAGIGDIAPIEAPKVKGVKTDWDKTPMDTQGEWLDMVSTVEQAREQSEPRLKELQGQLKTLKGKAAQEQKKIVTAEIDSIKGSIGELEAQIDDRFMSESEILRNEAIKKAKEKGLTDEDILDDFANQFVLEISPERPYIESNYKKTRSQIFDEVLDYYIKLPEKAPTIAELAKLPKREAVTEPITAKELMPSAEEAKAEAEAKTVLTPPVEKGPSVTAAPAPFSIGSPVSIKGMGPQVNIITETIPFNSKTDEPGDVHVKVRNEQTKEEGIYNINELKPIKRKGEIAAKKAAPPSVAVTPKVAEEKGKEPWKMTREEFGSKYIGAKVKGTWYIGEAGKEPVGIVPGAIDSADAVSKAHKIAVENANREGLPVPAEVLKDYPELQAKPKVEKPTPDLSAVKSLIPTYYDGSLNIMSLAGAGNVKLRMKIMAMLKGEKVISTKSTVTLLQAELAKVGMEQGKKPKEKVEVFNFTEDVKAKHPDLTDEDISYIARETAAQFEQVAARSKGQAKGIAEDAVKSWNRFAETGELPIAKKGQFEGQPKTFGDDEFYKQVAAFKKEEARAAKAPEEIEGIDLNVGDSFTVKGETHTVLSETEDGKLKIQNGTTQYVWPDETVEIDKGSLKKAEVKKEEPTKGKDQEMFAGVSKVPTAGLKTEKPQAEDLLAGFRKPEEDKQAGLFAPSKEFPLELRVGQRVEATTDATVYGMLKGDKGTITKVTQKGYEVNWDKGTKSAELYAGVKKVEAEVPQKDELPVEGKKEAGLIEGKAQLEEREVKEGYGISKSQFEDAIQRQFNSSKGYYKDEGIISWRQYLEKVDTRTIALELDSNSEIYYRYYKHVPEDVSWEDIIEAYKKGELPKEALAKAKTASIQIPEVIAKPLGIIGEPKTRGLIRNEELKILWGKANERITLKEKDAINKARYEIFMEHALTKDAPERLGLITSEVNKKIKSWTNFPAKGKDIQDRLNTDKDAPVQWQGISNSAWISKNEIKPKSIDDMVKQVDAPDKSWSTPDGNSLRNYIARTLLGIDTRILFKDLSFKVESTLKPNGLYESHKALITIRANSPHTVAHEIGHHLDYKWSKEAYSKTTNPASELIDSLSKGIISRDTSELREQWMNRFHEFVLDISERSEIGSNYYQRKAEVFARFVSKFVDWTNEMAGQKTWGEQGYAKDRFNEQDYRRFVGLLQEKAYVDIADGNPFSEALSAATAIIEGEALQDSYEALEKITLANIKKAIPHLENIGNSVYKAGMKYADFAKSMKAALGDMWNKFKSQMIRVYQGVKAKFKEERGSIPVVEGKPALSRAEGKGLTDTPEFKKWFSGSKVVDKDGNPLVVYHGTEKAGFASFDYDKGSFAREKETYGYHFTEDRRTAATYSGDRTEAQIVEDEDFDPRYEGSEGIYSVYLKMKNPYEIDFADEEGNPQGWDTEVDGFFGVDDVTKFAKDNEYDGVIVRNVMDEGPHGQGYGWGKETYIVFEPTQIKSIFNRGAFDVTDPNILASRGAKGPGLEVSLVNKGFKKTEEYREETNRLEEVIKRHGDDFTITPVSLPDTLFADDKKGLPKSDFDLAKRFASIFDKRIIWMQAEGPFSIEGVIISTVPSDIYIDVRADSPAHSVFGHELSHAIEQESPAIYQDLLDAVTPLLRKHSEFRNKYRIPQSVPREALTKEMIGNLLGDNFNNPDFWNEVGKAQPSLIGRIGDVVMKWLNAVLEKIRGKKGYLSEQFVSDIEATRKHLAKAVADYALVKELSKSEREEVIYTIAAGRYKDGMDYQSFAQGMKGVLGDSWGQHRPGMIKVFQTTKARFKEGFKLSKTEKVGETRLVGKGDSDIGKVNIEGATVYADNGNRLYTGEDSKDASDWAKNEGYSIAMTVPFIPVPKEAAAGYPLFMRDNKATEGSKLASKIEADRSSGNFATEEELKAEGYSEQEEEAYRKLTEEDDNIDHSGHLLAKDKKEIWADAKRTLDVNLGIISTRLGNIHLRIKAIFREHQRDLAKGIAEDHIAAKPFIAKFKKLPTKIRIVLSNALLDGRKEDADIIAKRHNLLAEMKVARKIFDTTRNRAIEAGLDVGTIENYWARVVKNPKKLLAAIRGQEEWSGIDAAIKRIEKEKGPLSEVEKSIIIDQVLRGYPANTISLTSTSHLKERKFKQIPKKYLEYYMPADQSLLSYITSMNNTIEAAKFFGKSKKPRYNEFIAGVRKDAGEAARKEAMDAKNAAREKDAGEQTKAEQKAEEKRLRGIYWNAYNKHVSNAIKEAKLEADINPEIVTEVGLDESIGSLINDLMSKGLLDPAKEQDVRDMAQAVFRPARTGYGVRAYKNLTYLQLLTQFTPAITQLQDFALIAEQVGYWNTLKTIGKVVQGKTDITIKDVHIERIMEELDEGQDVLSNLLRKALKLTGFTAMDRIGKESLLNAKMLQFQQQAKANDPKLRALVDVIFAESNPEQVMNDLAAGVKNDDTLLMLFNAISDMQPITALEVPEKYLTAKGIGKTFYALKTYQLKLFDVYRRDVWNEYKNGNKAEAGRKFVLLTSALILMGMGTDEIKDFMLGREVDWDDRIIDNGLKLFGFSKYTIYKVRKEGLGQGLLAQFAPPLGIVDPLSKDVDEFLRKGELEKGARFTANVPVAGKMYYWWLGRGAEQKAEDAEKRQKEERIRKNLGEAGFKRYQEREEKKSLITRLKSERTRALNRAETSEEKRRIVAKYREKFIEARGE